MLDTSVSALSARFEGVAELLMEFSKMEQRYQAVLAIQVDGLTVTTMPVVKARARGASIM